MKALSFFLATVVACADSAPKLSDAQRSKYWRAQAEFIQSQSQMERARQVLQRIVDDIKQSCGGSLAQGSDGEPECASVKQDPVKAQTNKP